MELTDRFEFKFLLSPSQWDAFFDAFGASFEPDTVGSPTGVYPVVSLYYDAPDFRCYWDAWRRLPSRCKLRVRVYGTKDGSIPETAFVEVKFKMEGRSYKHRVQTSLAHALEIASGGGEPGQVSPQAVRVMEQVQRMVREDDYRPTCLVRYVRKAYSLFVLPNEKAPLEEPLRITVDERIQYRFENLEPEPDDSRFTDSLLSSGQRILEVKGVGAIPLAVAECLGCHQIQPTSFSKYCEAISRKVHL